MKPRALLLIRYVLLLLVLLTAASSVPPGASAVVLRTACSFPHQSEEQHGEHGCEGSAEVSKKALQRRARHLHRMVFCEGRALRPAAAFAAEPVPARRPEAPAAPLLEFLSSSLGLRAPPLAS
jgi:hypothetical protein